MYARPVWCLLWPASGPTAGPQFAHRRAAIVGCLCLGFTRDPGCKHPTNMTAGSKLAVVSMSV
jgi:hypothetical protein